MNNDTENPQREEILSQEETDALLQGIEDGSVATSQGHGRPTGESRLYDFAECERVARGSMPTLQIINTRIARSLRTLLGELLRKPVEVESGPNQLRRYGEYIPTLPLPASLNLVRMRPLAGTMLVVPDTRLVLMSVDCFFGGQGTVPDEHPAREFTQVELRLITLLLESLFEAVIEGWRPVMQMSPELIGQEQNPHFAAIASAGDRVVVTEYLVRHLDQQASLQLVMPMAMLEPIEEMLDTAPRSDDESENAQWSAALRHRLEESTVGLQATLTQTTLRLGDVLNLQPGDVIPVEMPDEILLHAAGTPMFRGRAGTSRKHNAIEIIRREENA